MSNLVEVNNLYKYFSTKHGTLHAVEDVSFTLEKGQTLGVVGESGCGKSTLGRCVVRLLEPTSGSIVFQGKEVGQLYGSELKSLRREVQMIFQDPFSSLNPRMSIATIIAEPIKINKLKRGKDEIEKRVYELMDLVGLERRLANAYPHELDGGRRQRIGIARALAVEPEFIVCDEPVSALDVSIQAQILNLLEDLQDTLELSYLFITHDMSVVRHISDKLMVMYMGTVVETGSVEDVFKERLHPYTEALMAAIPIPDIDREERSKIIAGEISSPIDPPDACRFANRCKFAQDVCRASSPKLREITPGHQVACHLCEQIRQTGKE
ncbi:MAG: ATP-binding cassette domain-containing protein [Eubacteriales bacterium]|nr:ATP-binding cassette domain-containing protein [Eubacteriales bacterium]